MTLSPEPTGPPARHPRMSLRGALLVAAAVAALSCGGAASARPGAPGVVVVGQGQNGLMVQPRDGDTVQVALGTDLDWDIAISDLTVLAPDVGKETLVRWTQRLLRAAKPGTAIVTATGRPHCDTGQVCAQYLVDFRATVVVGA